MTPLLIGFFVFLLVAGLLADYLFEKVSRLSERVAPILILLTFFQTVSLLLDVPLAWPPELVEFIQALSIFNLNIELMKVRSLPAATSTLCGDHVLTTSASLTAGMRDKVRLQPEAIRDSAEPPRYGRVHHRLHRCADAEDRDRALLQARQPDSGAEAQGQTEADHWQDRGHRVHGSGRGVYILPANDGRGRGLLPAAGWRRVSRPRARDQV